MTREEAEPRPLEPGHRNNGAPNHSVLLQTAVHTTCGKVRYATEYLSYKVSLGSGKFNWVRKNLAIMAKIKIISLCHVQCPLICLSLLNKIFLCVQIVFWAFRGKDKPRSCITVRSTYINGKMCSRTFWDLKPALLCTAARSYC